MHRYDSYSVKWISSLISAVAGENPRWVSSITIHCKTRVGETHTLNCFSLWKLLFWMCPHLGVNIFQPKVMGNREKRLSACVSKYNADSLPHEQFCHWLAHLQWILAEMRTLPRALFHKWLQNEFNLMLYPVTSNYGPLRDPSCCRSFHWLVPPGGSFYNQWSTLHTSTSVWTDVFAC